MESAAKLILGFVLLLTSLAYLYRPVVILRLNAWGRALLFNDANLLHFRRRWGLLAFLGAILFLYSGFLNLAKSVPVGPAKDPLEEGYRAFYEGRFDEAAQVSVRYLRDHPGDLHGEFLLRQARRSHQHHKKFP